MQGLACPGTVPWHVNDTEILCHTGTSDYPETVPRIYTRAGERCSDLIILLCHRFTMLFPLFQKSQDNSIMTLSDEATEIKKSIAVIMGGNPSMFTDNDVKVSIIIIIIT